MSTYQFGGGTTRSFFAPNVNRGAFRKLSDADERLADAIFNGKSFTEEIPATDLEGKAMQTTTDGWQPESLGGQIIDIVRQKSRMRAFHQVINTPSDPYELPVNLQDFTVDYNVAEGAPGTDQTVPQGRIKFVHKKLMVSTKVSTEFEEDSVPQTMALLKQAIGEAIALEEEKRFFTEADGVLAKATDQTSAIGSISETTAADEIVDLLATMDFPYNLDPQNMVLYLNPSVYFKLLKSGHVRTIDQYGPNATIVTGELNKLYGMGVAAIGALPKGGTSPNFTYPIVIANRSSILIGQRRQLTIRVIPIDGDQNKIEATVRSAIAYPYAGKGIVKANATLA
ncbi:phage major capsid protein [Laceyella putida]|uniref:Phage major capsid protein n=1 Tax=Laceyella putida TaxID=110101 RepID=A0ABW2RQY8_9BACL